ncbi:MAG: hypothetical protein V3T30_01445 [Thermodesulfobacteriota bacterium]
MTDVKEIKFADIEKLFPEETWDVGFLSEDQLKYCAYSPIKGKAQLYGADFTNSIHYFSIVNSVVLVKHSPESWDYSLYPDSAEILAGSDFDAGEYFPIYTNFKEAAILAGLGVRARNSLVHSYKFGFDMKVLVIGFDDRITDVPEAKIDLGFLKECKDCDDCRVNCPPGAIRNEAEPYWLDSSKCDDFIGFGDDARIPSIKKFWHKNVHPEVPQEEVDNMRHTMELEKELAFDANGFTMDPEVGILKDGKATAVPFCRECQAQPRCSKWNGVYPYETA